MQIEVKNLNYIYSEKSKSLSVHALKDVSMVIPEGSFFGIVGRTGSGKSTFIQHLNGLLKVAKGKGEITIGEFNLSDKKCDFKALRSKVGMVFQYPEYQLFAETVEADVSFALKNFFPKMDEGERKSRVRTAIELVGLDYNKVKDKSPFDLSGGQKRRVAIAGVLVSNPEILVLDEPVAGLDPKGKREFTALLHALHGKVVKTIVIVSHDMDFVAENCTDVAVFDNGALVKTGTPKEIFNDAKRVEDLGLSLPLTAQILNAKGLYDDAKNLKEDTVVELLAKKFGGGL